MGLFSKGDEVRLVRKAAANAAERMLDLITPEERSEDLWEVVRLLPDTGAEPQYRIQAVESGREMVSYQSQLARAARAR